MSGVAIVTGGAKGLGRAYALALAADGWSVAVADVLDPEPVTREIRAAGGSAVGIRTDVSDEPSTRALAAGTLESFGRVDALVNNAAIFASIEKKPWDELTVEEWDRMFAVNVRGTWLCCKAVVPAMREAGGGRIVNVSSMTVPGGVPLFLHYVSSKAAIVGLTRALARELGDFGICVNAIAPDYVPHDAEYTAQQPEMAEIISRQRCFRRDMTADDLVGTLRYLVGPGAEFVTGQTLYVNGGRLFSGV